VAMTLVGHKTESVYRRCAIVNQADRSAAAGKLARLERSDGEATGTSRQAVAVSRFVTT
jgi:hypothetical protein